MKNSRKRRMDHGDERRKGAQGALRRNRHEDASLAAHGPDVDGERRGQRPHGARHDAHRGLHGHPERPHPPACHVHDADAQCQRRAALLHGIPQVHDTRHQHDDVDGHQQADLACTREELLAARIRAPSLAHQEQAAQLPGLAHGLRRRRGLRRLLQALRRQLARLRAHGRLRLPRLLRQEALCQLCVQHVRRHRHHLVRDDDVRLGHAIPDGVHELVSSDLLHALPRPGHPAHQRRRRLPQQLHRLGHDAGHPHPADRRCDDVRHRHRHPPRQCR